MIELPGDFIRIVKGVHGEKGVRWLDEFQGLIAECERRWSFRVGSPYPLSFNFVAPVTYSDGGEAVLKLGVPCKELSHEYAALNRYGGCGAVKVLDADPDRGILVLERINPGDDLKSISDDAEAVRIAAGIMRKIHVPIPSGNGSGSGSSIGFPTTVDWAKGFKRMRTYFHGGSGPIPEEMASKAERIYAKLNDSVKQSYFLHGDLHHGNILSSEREDWLAIDPKGLVGEPEYGVLQFLMNHLPEEGQQELIADRVRLFAEELGLDEERIQAWGFSHAVLSAWWCVEDDSGGAEEAVETARWFEALMKAR